MLGRKRKALRVGLVAVLTVATVLLFVYQDHATAWVQQAIRAIERAGASSASSSGAMSASGIIQARQISVASEFGGLVAELLVDEGARVEAGQPVVQLDTALLDGQIAVAEAMVEAAEAGLRQAQAGARPGQIAVAKAQLEQAQAGYLAAQNAVTDTQALVDTPQDLILQIAVMRQQLAAAEFREAEAIARKDAIEVSKGAFDDAYARFGGGGRQRFEVSSGHVADLVLEALPEEVREALPPDFGENLPHIHDQTFTYRDYELHVHGGQYELYVWKDVAFPLEAHLIPNLWWQTWVGVNAAAAQTEGLQAKLNHLYTQRKNPQALQAQLDAAVGLARQLEAQVALAEAQLAALEASLTPKEIAAVEARVGQARAGLAALRQQRDMLVVTAPISGTVVELLVHPGEVAAQGAALLTLADLSDMTLQVYLPETTIGEVMLDQSVEVRVDSFPGQVFAGRISYISDQAQFTPRNVATQEERQNLVFAVRIRLDNGEGLLKPGMPADVWFVAGEATP